MNVMRSVPHKTLVSVLRDYVQVWRQRERWSMSAAADRIVTHYYNSGFDGVWHVDFQRVQPGKDPLRVMNTNGERMARWLDDQTKESGILPLNLLPVVLSALPQDLRLMAVSEMLAPLGLEVGLAHTPEETASHAHLMASLAKEAGEGVAAFAALAERMSPRDLARAEAELREGIEAKQRALDHIAYVRAGSGHA